MQNNVNLESNGRLLGGEIAIGRFNEAKSQGDRRGI